MRINLTDIIDHDHAERNYELPLEMHSFSMREEEFPITESSSVTIAIENTGDQVLVIKAGCDLTIAIPCARCLDDVATTFQIERFFEANMKLTGEKLDEMLDEIGCIDGKELDVEVLIYNEILSRWPLQVLCSEECKGLCPNCGVNRNRTSCDCDNAVRDPRMAAISDIFRKSKEV